MFRRGGLAQAASGTFALKVCYAGLSFLAAVMLARVLGVREYGAYAFSMAWVALLGTCAIVGMESCRSWSAAMPAQAAGATTPSQQLRPAGLPLTTAVLDVAAARRSDTCGVVWNHRETRDIAGRSAGTRPLARLSRPVEKSVLADRAGSARRPEHILDNPDDLPLEPFAAEAVDGCGARLLTELLSARRVVE